MIEMFLIGILGGFLSGLSAQIVADKIHDSDPKEDTVVVCIQNQSAIECKSVIKNK